MTSFSDMSKYYFSTTTIKNTFFLSDDQSFDLRYLKNNFQYVPKKSITEAHTCIDISSDNPLYLQLNQIPEMLINIIVLSEDPNYFQHNGIDPHFIGIAIAQNILNKRFVKEASTITMQIVRNLLLHHSKTIMRKFEELLIAWLMEDQFKTSKERILEIYLNIIEFGENVYGVAAAAKYYFGKDVSKLNITECIVLSYIIPRPKYFLEAVLSKSPRLINNLTNHISVYYNMLTTSGALKREAFSEVEYIINFTPSIGRLVLK